MRSGNVDLNIKDDVTMRGIDLTGFSWSRLAVVWGSITHDTGVLSSASYFTFNVASNESVAFSRIVARLTATSLRCLSTAVEGEGECLNLTRPPALP